MRAPPADTIRLTDGRQQQWRCHARIPCEYLGPSGVSHTVRCWSRALFRWPIPLTGQNTRRIPLAARLKLRNSVPDPRWAAMVQILPARRSHECAGLVA